MQHCLTTVWKNQKVGNDMAEKCVDVIQVLDAVRKGSPPELLERMSTGCSAMPINRRSQCKEMILHDIDEVFLLLNSDLPSAQIASALGLCGGFPDTVSHGQVSGDYCTDCINFFSDIREIVNNSQAQIDDLLKNEVCTKLGPLKDLCGQLVDMYVQTIFTIIDQQLNPQDLCLLLQMCKNQTHAELMKSIQYIMAKHQRSQMTCDLCQSIAKDVQDALRDTSVQKDIVSALENNVCTLLPANLVSQCKSYVEGYAPFVFQILVSELDPKTLCQSLGLCNSTASVQPMVAVPLSSSSSSVKVGQPQVPGPQCALCELVMDKLEGLLVNNATEEQIEAALEKVCNFLPKTLSTECDAFVKEYSQVILQILLKQVTPKAVCSLLGLCASNNNPVEVIQKPLDLTNGTAECMICQQVVTYVKAELEKSTAEQTIEQILDRVCSIVPKSYKAACDQFVQTYTPTIIMLIEQFADPKQICSAIGLCKNGNKEALKFQPMLDLVPAQPHLVGSIKCTWGPSYWCQNEHTARECNAIEHCVKYRNLKIGA